MIPVTREQRIERGLQEAMREGAVRTFRVDADAFPEPQYLLDLPGQGEVRMTPGRAEAFCIGVLMARRARREPEQCQACGGLPEPRHASWCAAAERDDAEAARMARHDAKTGGV